MSYVIRRLVVAVSVLCVLVGAVATVAMAWSDVYVSDAVYAPGNGNRSGYNYSLKGNAVEFRDIYGGTPQMCSEYVDSNGVPLNSAVCHPSTFIDSRTISYGAARCWSDTQNNYEIHVDECDPNN